MNEHCQQNLKELRSLLGSVSMDQYQNRLGILSGASIGQHIRHILEFYLCLINAAGHENTVNYDKRRRSLKIEQDPKEAIDTIDEICHNLSKTKRDGILYLEGNYSNGENGLIILNTTFQRELAYCLEHAIHHQALIKIGLQELGLSGLIDRDFGIAPATVRFNQQRD